MFPRRVLLLLAALCSLLHAPCCSAQGALGKTTMGKAQNSDADLVNSLVPGPPKYGKGEKKSEVDPKTLQSKKSSDKTFSGSLNDIGLDWSGEKMGKPHSAGEAEPKSAKQAEATAEKDSKPVKSSESSKGENKDEKPSAGKANDKSSEKEKPSAAKPDGDH